MNPTMETLDSIQINDQLQLQAVDPSQQARLFQLMMDIYRPVYQHLWHDDGSGYVHSQFNPENLKAELVVPHAHYYFVISRGETIGILRFIMDCPTSKLPQVNCIKLHRIYLAPATHGKGIGKLLMVWLEGFAQENGQQTIWLECMDTQLAAYKFYQKLGYSTLEPFVLESPKMKPEYRGMIRMKLDVFQ